MTDIWIKKGSGSNVESIESQCINISTYIPLSRSSYMNFPVEIKSPRKGLINIKNIDQKCFLWCPVRHINPLKGHPEIILKIAKKIAEKLDYDRIEFPVQEKNLARLWWTTIYTLTCLIMKMCWFFQFMFQNKNLKTLWICCF